MLKILKNYSSAKCSGTLLGLDNKAFEGIDNWVVSFSGGGLLAKNIK